MVFVVRRLLRAWELEEFSKYKNLQPRRLLVLIQKKRYSISETTRHVTMPLRTLDRDIDHLCAECVLTFERRTGSHEVLKLTVRKKQYLLSIHFHFNFFPLNKCTTGYFECKLKPSSQAFITLYFDRTWKRKQKTSARISCHLPRLLLLPQLVPTRGPKIAPRT